MNKDAKAIVLILVFLFMTGVPHLYALGLELGIYGGKDYYTIPHLKKGFVLADLTQASVERDGFQDPIMLGAVFRFNLIGGYAVSVRGEAVYLNYHVVYARKLSDNR